MNAKDTLAQAAKLVEDGQKIAAAAEAEGRDLTTEEKGQLEGMLSDARALKNTAKVLGGLSEESEFFASTRGNPIAGKPEVGESEEEQPKRPDRRSIGQQFVSHPDWLNYRKAVAPNGFSEKTQVGASPQINFDRILPMTAAQRALITGGSDTSAGAFVFNDVQPGYYPQGLERPLTFRDVITVGSTDSDTVEYVRLTGQTNAAAMVAESTVTSGSGLTTPAQGVKPESNIALAKVTANVRTIAHYLAATKRALSDAGQMRTLIDNFLRYGLEEELEDQMVNGGGTGEDFEGIATLSTVQSQAWDSNLLTTTRKARTLVRTVGRAVPTAYLLNPLDWQAIDLLQDNEARYYFGGPSVLGTPRLWGLPVVECEAVPQGTGYVGDFRKVVLWEREGASIQVSDSHADFFIRNMVAILAEMRAAFGVVQPTALVEMDLTA